MGEHPKSNSVDRTIELHFKAELRLLSTADGGRQTPIKSGYVGDLSLRQDMLNGCQIQVVDGQFIAPGEVGIILVRLLRPEFQDGRLYGGMEFGLLEGFQIIGTVRILEVLDKRLSRDTGN